MSIDRVAYQRTGTYCPISSHNFADYVTGQLLTIIEDYQGESMDVGAYTPPYDECDFPAGFITVTVWGEVLPAARFGIEFGRRDVEGNLVRKGFDADAWRRDSDNPHAGCIYAVNFDEAWRIVCTVGRYLGPKEITLTYGY